MNKKKLIAISVIALLIIGALYFLLPHFSKQDLSKYVPAEAFFTMKMDIAQIGGKVDPKEIQNLQFFKNEVMDELKSSEKEKMEKMFQNPLTSGIQLRTAPLFFLYQQSANETVGVLLWGISDASDFKAFISDMSDELSVKDTDDEGFYELVDDNEDAKLYFNGDLAMWIMDLDHNEISFKQIRDKLISIDDKGSILSKASYNELNTQGNDVFAYLNKEELSKVMKDKKMSSSRKRRSEMQALSYMPEAMSLNFNEDAISIKAYSSEGSEALKMMKEDGISTEELKNISPKSNPFAFLSLNFDSDKMIDAILDAAEMQNESAREDFNENMDGIAAMLGTDRASLMKLFSGKMSLSCAGSVEQMKPQFFSDEMLATNYPGVYFWAKINDKNLCNSIMSKFVEMQAAKETDGIYAMNEESYSPSMYMAIKGDDFFLSTDKNGIVSKVNGDNWKAVGDEMAVSIATSNPVAAFVDLDYRNYEEILKTSMGASEMDVFEKLKTGVLSSFKHIRLVSKSDNETELVVQMSEAKKNSLQRIILMLDEAYRVAN